MSPDVLETPDPPHIVTLDTLLIERATRAHVPYLRRLKEQVMASRYRPAGDEEGFARWREVYCTNSYFEQLVDDPCCMLLSIGSLREPVGMVVLHKRGKQLEIDDLLCLHPGRGDGTRLLKACLQYAQAWRMQEVVIDIYPGQEGSHRFLERHGFARVADSSNDLGRPMDRYSIVVPSD